MRNDVLRTGRDESACAGLEGALLEELFEDGGLADADASSNNDAAVLLRVLTTQLLHNNKGQFALQESDSECDVFFRTMPHLFYLAVDPLSTDEHGGGLGVWNLEVNRRQVQLRRSNRRETNYKYKHRNLVRNELQVQTPKLVT